MSDGTNEPRKVKVLRGTGRILKRGEIWWVAYYVNGMERRESSKSTNPKNARKLLKERFKQLHGGRYAGPEEEKLTVVELLNALETNLDNKGAKAQRRSHSSSHISSPFGSSSHWIERLT